MKEHLIEIGKRVITQEAEALLMLASGIDKNFTEALNLIVSRHGRIAVAGVGKSSHIGRKISATLSSMGSPSYFIHPGEAAHGDMGMLTQDDILLAISNSGSTKEFFPLLHFCNERNIPIIAITRNPASPLAKIARIILLLNHEFEAGEPGVAPTTSAACTLALGDALSIALAAVKGFSRDDFQALHPGGWLGLATRSVKDIMRVGSQIPVVDENATASEVLMEMTVKGLGCSLVQNESKKLLGIITDGDIRRHLGGVFLERNAKELMTGDPVAISLRATAGDAVAAMNSRKITAMPVLDGNEIKGIVHLHDCLASELLI